MAVVAAVRIVNIISVTQGTTVEEGVRSVTITADKGRLLPILKEADLYPTASENVGTADFPVTTQIAFEQSAVNMLALLAGQVAAASAAADAAAEASSLAPDAFAVAVAKSRAGEAAGKGAEIAHQVHGAMGYTREHNLHYSTRRLWSWRDEFGNETCWQIRLGRVVAAQGADALWPMLSRL